MQQVEGNIVDIHSRKIFPGVLSIDRGKILSIHSNSKKYTHYISPGFIDAHVHIESSMLLPEEFSRLAIRKGTIGIISDPHEIANVKGIPGIEFMLKNSKNALIKMFFTIPSCVPATPYDASGACINASEVCALLETGEFIGLSEVMNIPGVLNEDPEIMAKIQATLRKGKIVDGHAPGLTGKELKQYIQAGISTDHESTKYTEALEKISAGMKILIREGSAAKNYEALKELIRTRPEQVMFCMDDAHPDDLYRKGHIDQLVKRAIQDGFDLFDVLRIACLNPVKHYGLNIGTLNVGDRADFVIFRDLTHFGIESVYVDGKKRYENSRRGEIYTFPNPPRLSEDDIRGAKECNCFCREQIEEKDLQKSVNTAITCIRVIPDEIVTLKETIFLENSISNFESDPKEDVLKLVYLNRYKNLPPQIAYVRGIGIERGAFGSSISHDSHNILAVGCTDREIVQAIHGIIREKGGISVVDGAHSKVLSLPVGGIMTFNRAEEVIDQWEELMKQLKDMGTSLKSPLMTLSFLALLVIPELKIGEKGLFEYSNFRFISD